MAVSHPTTLANSESIVRLYTDSIRSMYTMTSGEIRSKKGKLVPKILDAIVRQAWHEIGALDRLEIRRQRVEVPINAYYVRTLTPESTKTHVKENIAGYIYRVELDRAVLIDERLVLGIECKSYTENAMLKRVLKDFELTLQRHPEMLFCVFQLENALGGDYGEPCKMDYLGSESTHTLLSHSPVCLEIITLLNGNRTTQREIHRPAHFKALPLENVEACVKKFQRLLSPFV